MKVKTVIRKIKSKGKQWSVIKSNDNKYIVRNVFAGFTQILSKNDLIDIYKNLK